MGWIAFSGLAVAVCLDLLVGRRLTKPKPPVTQNTPTLKTETVILEVHRATTMTESAKEREAALDRIGWDFIASVASGTCESPQQCAQEIAKAMVQS